MATLNAFVGELKRAHAARIVAEVRVAAREPRWADVPARVSAEVAERLRRVGVERLYEHQARAVSLLLEGADVVVTAGTSGGKTLAYLVPVLEAVLGDENATALLLYPTKALAQDQLGQLGRLAPDVFSACYDGDTPAPQRRLIRQRGRVVLSNVDMLHAGILPNHRQWARFLSNLRYVVVDEAHAYRGTFGSNAAMVLRRLERLAVLCGGSTPYRYALASATLANPEEHARRLTGRQVAVVDDDASRRPPRTFLFWNPPYLPARGRRGSSHVEVADILASAIRAGVRTIAFSRSKLVAELVARYAKERLRGPEGLARRVAVYRAGYLPSERRDLESRLFSGELRGVSATSALELGIDIGDLDLTVINGFPGTISSFFQQAGRSGRLGESAAVYVAGEDPLDQHYAAHPEELFEKPVEAAIVSTDNPYLLASHILCACYEHPMKEEEVRAVFDEDGARVASRLSADGYLHRRGARLYPAAAVGMPHANVSIRAASPHRFQIVEEETGALKGELDEHLAYIYLHPGAVYLQQAETYLVRALRLEDRVALVSRRDVTYYTQPKEDSRVTVDRVLRHRIAFGTQLFFGDLTVESRVLGYRKRHAVTHEALGYVDLDLPPHTFSTRGLWFVVPDRLFEALDLTLEQLAGGIHAIEHAAIGLLPLYAGCDRWDIGGVSTPAHYVTDEATIFIYDGIEGGLGYAERGFDSFEALVSSVRDLVERCPCEHGCPSCVQSPKCGNLNEPLDKGVAIRVLNELVRARGA